MDRTGSMKKVRFGSGKKGRKTWTNPKSQKTLFSNLRAGGSLKSMVNSMIMRKSETKHLVGSAENIQLYHNCGVVASGFGAIIFNPWQSIAQGASSIQRIGTEVYPLGMSVRLELFNKLDRPNLTYRIVVLEVPKYYNGAGTNSQFDWRDTTGSLNSLLAFMKPDTGIKVLYDKIVKNEAHFSAAPATLAGDQDGKECHIVHQFYVRANSRNKLIWDVQNQLINKPWALYIIPYDSYGSLTLDNVASCAINTKYFFKDC